MAEYLRCPECDHRFRPPPRALSSRTVRCPACDARVDRGVDEPSDDGYGGEEFSSRRRTARRTNPVPIVAGVIIGALLFGVILCGGLIYLGYRALVAPTPFPEQTEDYAEARRKFRTKLLQREPAPQAWDDEMPPPGVQSIEYVSGQLRLKAWVNRPALEAGRKHPAVLFLHGGFAFGASDWHDAQPFRDAGFIVMTPMLRGENGLPGDYTMFFDEVDDVLAAAEALAKLPYVDPQRVFVAGHSAGGTLTLLAAMTSNRFRAAASFSGSPDQKAFALGQEELVPFDDNDLREYQMRSPLAFPRSFKCPVRIYYGSQEFMIGPSSKKTAEKARAAGLDVEAVETPGDHFTSVAPAMRRAIAFFQQQQPR